MTSPLSSLRKTKRMPLQRSVPFRPVIDIETVIQSDMEKLSESIQTETDDCQELVDDVTKTILSQKKSSTTIAHRKPSHGTTPTDMDLMSSMMARISQLQLRVQFHEKTIAEKEHQIKMLESQLKCAQKSPRHGDRDSKLLKLEKENRRLQKQVYDMEEFLADYGMLWAGSDDSDSEAGNSGKVLLNPMWEPKKSISEFTLNYDLIIENIRDLNILAGEGETQVQRTPDGATLKLPDPVNLSLYANGMLMFNGPFRPFTEQSTQQCINDLTDGFFPTELQKRYPNGVLFSVRDYRTLHYEDKSKKVFTGEGQILGGDTKPSRLVPSNLNQKIYEKHTKTSLSHTGKLSTDKFLSKLPSNVVKSGRIIDIRQAVSDMILGDTPLPNSISVVNTGIVDNLRKSARQSRRPEESQFSDDCSTLRIKHGDVTYVLFMKGAETIGDVRKHLCEHSSALAATPYDLVSSYPRRTFDDNTVTLQDAGLTPNAMLHLRLKKN